MNEEKNSDMQVENRRQTIVRLATGGAALLLAIPALRRMRPRRASHHAGGPADGSTPASSTRRVHPAPHSVRRHG